MSVQRTWKFMSQIDILVTLIIYILYNHLLLKINELQRVFESMFIISKNYF